MRSLWKGSLSFGLVNIPVAMYTATEDRSPSFNQLRASDHSRIGYKRVAKADDQEVPYDEIVKGYEYEPDRYVVFDKEELDAMRPASSRTIEVLQFTPLEQIDPIYYQRAYYLAPEPAGAKAYALRAESMGDRGVVAICKVSIRDKEHLATVRLRRAVARREAPTRLPRIRDRRGAGVEGAGDPWVRSGSRLRAKAPPR
jgi:DNA end-binding protein Ku